MQWWANTPIHIQKMMMAYVTIKTTGQAQPVYAGTVTGRIDWPTDERLQAELCRAWMELKEYFR